LKVNLFSRFKLRTLPPVLRSTTLLSCCLCLCLNAWAAPDDRDDRLASLLPDRSVVTQISERLDDVRQVVGEHASTLVGHAMGFLGVPYRRGGDSAETGFDCSGFVRSVYEQTIGLVLPRRAAEQAAATQNIDRQDLRPGDLVFFNTMRRAFSHVGIYVGDGKFIHAPRAGEKVRVEDMRIAYWNTRFNGARRVVGDEANTPRR
jgi:hypothetical protein